MPDDCEELTKLRMFRDTYMTSSAGRARDLEQYYHESPKMVYLIAARTDREEIYAEALKSIKEAVREIDLGNYATARSIYSNEFTRLRTALGISNCA